MGNPDAKNRCDREQPDCRPIGIGGDCWTPKQLAKYGIDPADVAAEPCVKRVYADFLYQWNDCMSGCYTSLYGTQPIDEQEQRQLESKKKKKKKNDKDQDGDGTPDSLDNDRDGDGINNDDDRNPDKNESEVADKEDESFPDTDPNDGEPMRKRPKRGDVRKYNATTTSWRAVTICKAVCAERVRIDYSPCFCDRVKCGPDDDELGGEFDRITYDPTDPAETPTEPDDYDPTKGSKTSLKVTDSSWGVPIEIVYGQHVVAGNVVWIAPTRRETKVSVRSLLFGARATSASGLAIKTSVIDFAIGLCAGQQGAITRIYVNDALFYDANNGYARVGKFNYGDKGGRGQELIKDTLFFYDGSEAQKFPVQMFMDDEYPIAYRDLAMLVFKGLDLRTVGNKFPSIRVEIAQEVDSTPVKVTTSLAVTPVDARGLPSGRILVDEGNPGGYKLLSSTGGVISVVSGASFDASAFAPISDTYIVTQRGAVIESRLMRTGTLLSTYAAPISNIGVYGDKAFIARGRGSSTNVINYFVINEAPFAHFHKVENGLGLVGARISVDIGNGVYGGAFVSYYNTTTLHATESVVFVKYDGQLKLVECVMASTDGGAGFTFNAGRPPSVTVLTGAENLTAFVPTGIAVDNNAGVVVLIGRVGPVFAAMAINVVTKKLLWATKYTFTAPLSTVWNFAAGGLNGAFTICDGTTTYVIDSNTGAIIVTEAIGTTAGVTLNTSSGGVLLGLSSSSLDAINARGVTPVTADVADIVYDIALRSLVSPADVHPAETAEIVGYKIDTESPAKTFLAELATVTGVAIFDDGGRLFAQTPAGATSVPSADLGAASAGERVVQKIRDDASRPSAQEVRFFDATNSFAERTVLIKPDTEPNVLTGNAATFSTNVVLTPNDALALAERLAALIPMADVTAKFELGPKYLNLTPGDPLLLTALDGALHVGRIVTVGSDKTLAIETKQYTAPLDITLPDIEPPVIVDTVTGSEAGMPIIIQAKPVTFEDTQLDQNRVTFYAGVIGDIGETTLNMFVDGAYVARQTVTKPLAYGVVSSSDNYATDIFGPQWEVNDALTVVFSEPPDTSIWYQAKDINDVTSADMTANLLLVGREWMQFKTYEVAIDGVTVTFRDIFRGLRGSDVYQGDVMANRVVYAYDPASWGKFEISKTSAALGAATIVARSLDNPDAVPEAAQSIISMEASYHWPIRRLTITRDMAIDWLYVNWQKRSRFNGPLDDDYMFSVPEIGGACEIFVIKDDFDVALFRDAVTSIYSNVFEWNSTSYVRMYQIVNDDLFRTTVPSFTGVGIDYLTQKFHIVVRTIQSATNPSAAGHYLVATYDPAVNTDHLTGKVTEPTSYTLVTLE